MRRYFSFIRGRPYPVRPDIGSLDGRRADVNLDAQAIPMVGRAIPAPLAYLAASFLLCTLVVAGLPPLSGFVGKVAMLQGVMEARSTGAPAAAWVLFALLIVSSLTASI